MDSFLVDSDSATVIPKDLGEMPKEQFANADLFSDHSRFPSSNEEKTDISQKFSAEDDLLGHSFSMPPKPVPDYKMLTHEKDTFDDFFLEAETKKTTEPATADINTLLDIGAPDFLEPQKKPNNDAKQEKQIFTDSAPFGAGPDEPIQAAKNDIESDYMNPYAEVRSNTTAQSQKHEEPSAGSNPSSDSVEKEDIFSAFASHNKKDHFVEPHFEDSSSAGSNVAAAAAVVAPPEPPAPVAVPPPTPAVTENVTPPKPVAPVKQPSQEKPKPAESSEQCIQAEKLFKQFGLDAWFKPEKLHPKVESLIYWRDVKKSAIVAGSGLTILLAMSLFSLISVFSYVSLLVLFGTVSFRIYKNVLQAVQKTSEGHPFKEYLDIDLTLSQEKVQQLTTVAVAHANALLSELRRLFLVEDLVDSIKFGVVLYCLTYVGAIFNGMTCVIIAFVALFTLPKVYENNKQSIDAYLELVRSKILEITEKVKAAVPLGKKVESDKEK
ncbi:reticulon-1 isoform X1 [Malaya genurostris]|uniref:reticulon-1 isoform X1 n=1 Tax=Malaya genurostris TaxID=325434 RepID=UPI0026F3835F|nr:reticulon-1 isoform X1 [Malaya genurostris]